jgi:CubicO group peptidase (beta-lactamase class C family)
MEFSSARLRRCARARRASLLAIAVGLLALAACSPAPRATPRAAPATGAPVPAAATATAIATPTAGSRRDYWPTSGWRAARPEDHGIDPGKLAEADTEIFTNLPDVYSLLVIRHGYLVYEKYYAGSDAAVNFGLRSATKSFASAMIGIALRDGALESVDQKVADLLPEYFTQVDDARKKDITIRHLLNMTSGFAWDETNAFLPLAPGGSFGQSIVDLPLDSAPGEKFNYSSVASQLLSILFTKVTGKTMWDVAARELFAPIGIPNTHWPADSDGNSQAYSGLVMPARELAKFGFLYLNGGAWDGEQIIPADYARASVSRDGAVPVPDGGLYGYLWWLVKDRGHEAFMAAGYGGQYVYIAPDLDLLVVMTGNPQVAQDAQQASRYIIRDYIVPAADASAGAAADAAADAGR